ETVYAVSALIPAPDPAAAIRVLEESPELLRPAAVDVFDAIIADAEALGEDAPYDVAHLRAKRDVVSNRLERATEAAPPAAEDGPAGSGTAEDVAEIERATALAASGQVEQALAVLTGAAARARAADDPAAEGRAEYALHELVFGTLWPAPGTQEQMAQHADAAVTAFGRAGDHLGLAASLRRLAAVALDLGDTGMFQSAWLRLISLDPLAGVWWFTYASAVGSDDPELSRAQLLWCADNAARLGSDADRFHAVCQNKLAFLESRAVSDGSGLPPEIGALLVEIAQEGPSAENGRRLEDALVPVEIMRAHAQTDTVQHALSALCTPVYEMLSSCVAGDGPEASVGVLERNTARSLLAHIGGRNGTPSGEDEAAPRRYSAEGEARHVLDGLLAGYLAEPTQQHLDLLTSGFSQARRAKRQAEHQALRDVSGPLPAEAPVRVDRVRELLGDDAVVFCGAPGTIFLVSREGSRIIGSFERDDLAAVAASFRRTGTGPVDALAALLADHVPHGARIFLVPDGDMWKIPLASLGEPRLSDHYQVASVPSLSVLATLLGEEPVRGRPTAFAGLADPDGSLPHARGEVDRAAACFAEATIHSGPQASPAAYRGAAAADVIHLACHGFHLPGYPDFTGLRLAGRAGTPAMLWYDEIARTRLTASLVVLGACHAGTGAVLSGAEYVGLPGALLVAGATTVLAPLWEVDDELTARLMDCFYPAYLETGSAALALRHAQYTVNDARCAAFQLFGLP
ncbi:CHAT domain-containing protein, partial [Lentzea sp.]|uniref:CHAT domain-containing protein n=1 Tax=Lentzea sp. TaxID=56099 RepID=UPI002ED17164